MSKSKSVTKKPYWEELFDEFNPHWEKMKAIMEKHPKGTFKFLEHESAEHGWQLEVNLDLLGLPKDTKRSDIYNTKT